MKGKKRRKMKITFTITHTLSSPQTDFKLAYMEYFQLWCNQDGKLMIFIASSDFCLRFFSCLPPWVRIRPWQTWKIARIQHYRRHYYRCKECSLVHSQPHSTFSSVHFITQAKAFTEKFKVWRCCTFWVKRALWYVLPCYFKFFSFAFCHQLGKPFGRRACWIWASFQRSGSVATSFK